MPDDLWSVVEGCWDQQPSKRHCMTEVVHLLHKSHLPSSTSQFVKYSLTPSKDDTVLKESPPIQWGSLLNPSLESSFGGDGDGDIIGLSNKLLVRSSIQDNDKPGLNMQHSPQEFVISSSLAHGRGAPGSLGPRTQQHLWNPFVGVPLLARARFKGMYKTYRATKNTKHARLMSIDSQPTDLHALHTEVVEKGGGNMVSNPWFTDHCFYFKLCNRLIRMSGGLLLGGKWAPPSSLVLKDTLHCLTVKLHGIGDTEYLPVFDILYAKSVLKSRQKQQHMVVVHCPQKAIEPGETSKEQQQNSGILDLIT